MFAKAKYLKDETMPERFRAQEALLPGRNLTWLQQRREAAMARFVKTGYPTTTLERWRFSNVKPVLALHSDARPNQGDICEAAAKLDALPPGPRMVFVDGVFNGSLSTIADVPGMELLSLKDMLAGDAGHVEAYLGQLSARDETHGFAQLSLAFAQDGIVLRLEEGVELEQPVAVAHIFTGGARADEVAMRNLFILKAGAKATLVEYCIGAEGAVYTANSTSEIFVAGAASFIHVLVQEESAAAAHVNSRYVRQERESTYHGVVCTSGARLSRVETQALLAGENADFNLHTVQLVKGKRHADSTTDVVHDCVGGTSNQHCRMIVDDHAKGAFQGKTTVARDAQKTDAQQLNKNLLLSRNAQVDAKPELEIYADDVKCSHGATTGELDEMALFYLKSRGMDEPTAKRLLVEAFADNAIEEALVEDDIKTVLRDYVAEWMNA